MAGDVEEYDRSEVEGLGLAWRMCCRLAGFGGSRSSPQVRELPTVEIALAAIDQVDKVHFIGHINKLPDETLKSDGARSGSSTVSVNVSQCLTVYLKL